MYSPSSSEIELLRSICERQGVYAEDADLEAVRRLPRGDPAGARRSWSELSRGRAADPGAARRAAARGRALAARGGAVLPRRGSRRARAERLHLRSRRGGARRGGAPAPPAGRSRGAGRGQGRDRRRRHAHDRGLGDPPRQRGEPRTPRPSRACGAAGAIVLGKLNTHEFAFGALTTSPHFGPARNPWALDRICGGSSGGSGAAVAAELAAGHARHRHRRLDPDPGLLLRRHRPAARRRASSRPTASFPSSRSFDTVGPLARSAEDCALLLEALAALTPTEPAARAAYGSASSRRCSSGPTRASPRSCVDGGRARARSAQVERVELPLLEEAGAIQQTIMLPEAADGAPALAARAAGRLRRRRPRAPARGAAAALDRVRRPACERAAWSRASCERAVRALRPARRAGDAGRRAADRRGAVERGERCRTASR